MDALSGIPLRNEYSGALLDLVEALAVVVAACRDEPPGPTSEAVIRLADPLNTKWWRGDNAVRNVHEDASVFVLSALDHVRTFARIIRNDLIASTSTATLARGALEAFGRAHWVLTGSTAREGLIRDTHIAYFDLLDLLKVRPKQSLTRAVTGTVFGPAEIRDQIVSWLTQIGEPKPSDQIGQARIASDVLLATIASYSTSKSNTKADQAVGKQVYSDLSATAHAQSHAINYFITYQPDAKPSARYALRPNDQVLTDYVSTVAEVLVFVGDTFVKYFEPDNDTTSNWQLVRDRAQRRRLIARSGD